MPIFADSFGWFWVYRVVAALSVFSAIDYLILVKCKEEIINN
ncbi:UNVERIFIED_CONTAM: glycerol-3-phosphate transporter [Streptococcus canis]|nr:glycerol-3-phosphate transporter [Streptococcus canis]